MSFVIKFFMWREYQPAPFMLELPDYKLPRPRSIAIGVYTRARMFLQRAGTTILSMMVLIWFLASFPLAPAGAEGPAINYSLAAMMPGMAQAKLDSSGMKARPCRPAPPMMRSIKNAARAM